MSEFYRRLLSGDAPAEALAAAQRWLASLSLGELRSWVERAREHLRDEDSAEILATWSADLARTRGVPPTTRPYASPYYWAAFTVVGAA
jgi:CHAT domain-containing protein